MPQRGAYKIKYSWALDYKPEPKNRTGYKLFLKTLPKCDWKPERGRPLSKGKLPRTMKDYAKLNRVLQAHIYRQFANRARNDQGELFYNETFHQ